jgi:hypothetical protein
MDVKSLDIYVMFMWIMPKKCFFLQLKVSLNSARVIFGVSLGHFEQGDLTWRSEMFL